MKEQSTHVGVAEMTSRLETLKELGSTGMLPWESVVDEVAKLATTVGYEQALRDVSAYGL